MDWSSSELCLGRNSVVRCLGAVAVTASGAMPVRGSSILNKKKLPFIAAGTKLKKKTNPSVSRKPKCAMETNVSLFGCWKRENL
jgi:hypothetical protein